ncbi:C-factor [Dactylella cylindrospora]|nr:C-factor [Dactylella cylindrospora]
MPVYVITGAARGIGHGLAKTLSETPSNTVIVAVRDPSVESVRSLAANAKATFHALTLDQSSESSIISFADKVASLVPKVDYLINNAAIKLSPDDETPANINHQDLLDQMTTNVVGPALITKHLISRGVLQPGSLVMNTSSGIGSVANTLVHNWHHALGYSLTKAAINLLSAKQAIQWKDITFISVDPGWVKTDMGGAGAAMEIQSSVDGIINTIHTKTLEHSGGFFLHDGRTLPY